MKTVIIGDLHIGIRNGNQYFFDMMKNFFKNKFFPFLYENNITRVIQLGDILDKRKTIDFTIAKFLINDFFGKFEESNIEFYSISGNHDLYYRQSISLDGPSQFTSGCKHVHIVKEPIILDNFVMIPWVCDENINNIVKFLEDNKDDSRIVLGHFELAGFPVIKGHISDKGTIKTELFHGYQKVLSGHYHSPSMKDNIIYVGTPYELSWNEYGDKKKYYIYDDVNNELTPVYTNESMFVRIDWNNRDSIDISKLKGKYIRVITDENTDEKQLSSYLLSLDKQEIADIKVLHKESIEEDEVQDETIVVDDIVTIMMTYIDENIKNNDVESHMAKTMVTDIYKQAQDKQ